MTNYRLHVLLHKSLLHTRMHLQQQALVTRAYIFVIRKCTVFAKNWFSPESQRFKSTIITGPDWILPSWSFLYFQLDSCVAWKQITRLATRPLLGELSDPA